MHMIEMISSASFNDLFNARLAFDFYKTNILTDDVDHVRSILQTIQVQ
jgi:hypothetical protein